MDSRHQLQGLELRYALTMYLLQHGPTTVGELVDAMEWQGFAIGGRSSKQIRTPCAGKEDAGGYDD